MGRDSAKIEIHVSLERHNGPEDATDDQAADDLVMEIRALVASTPAYARIVDDIWGR